MKKTTILIAIAVALIGCSNPSGKTPTEPVNPGKIPGKFSATVLSDTIGSQNAARGVSLGTFTVSNSKSIYFILRNVGDFPITNITLTAGKLLTGGATFQPISDNGITASPGAITVLETSGNATVETVIEVDINHGNVVGLISQQYIQKADFAGATLRIAGKTTDEEGEILDVSLDVDIETFIKVASFEVHYSANGGATYTKAEYGMPPFFYATEPNFLIPYEARSNIKIRNTGNVPLRYKVMKNSNSLYSWEYVDEYVNLNVGEYSSALVGWSSTSSIGFVIDTIGVAFDNGGIEDLAFRPDTSVIISKYNKDVPLMYAFLTESYTLADIGN